MKAAHLFLVLGFLWQATDATAAVWPTPTPTLGESFGVQVKETQTSDEDLRQMKEAGLHYVRFVLPWYEVEKGKDSFVWGYFDSFIERVRDHGLGAVVVLGGGHPAYTGWVAVAPNPIDPDTRTLAAPRTKEAIEGFAHFAAKAAEKFGSKDIVWEIWNEPDSDIFWAPKADSEAYAALADASCRAIRRVQPEAVVIGPGMADTPGKYGPWVPGFLSRLLQSPASACLNAVSVHPYRDFEKPPETVLTAYKNLRAYIAAFTPKGQTPPLFLSTEWGFTLADVSEDEQAAYLLRTLILNAASGVPLSIWYEWRDSRSDDKDPEAHFGLMTRGRKPKKALEALRAFLPLFADAHVEKRIELDAPDVFVFQIKHADGRRALVFWSSAPRPQKALAIGEQLEPLSGMPRVIELSGEASPTLTLRAAASEEP